MSIKFLPLKRAVRTALLVLLLNVVGLTNAMAQSFTVGNLNYSVNSDGVSVTLTGHVDGTSATGPLVIPESVTYNGTAYSVTMIGYMAFRNNTGLTGNLVIPNSVTNIGTRAFQSCIGFTGVLTIGTSLTTTGSEVFEYCSGLTEIHYNAINCEDSYNVLVYCDGLHTLVIGDNVERIPGGWFSGRAFTGSLTIPNSVTSIGESAFSGCSGFTGSLTIPNSVTSIGQSAFSGCSGFTGSLTIPNSVTSIGQSAFSGCSGFTGSLTIPNSVTSIGQYAFSGCSGFTGSLTIGNSVTEISYAAFSGCSGFTGSLTIGNSVTIINANAFSGCRGFTGSLNIPNSVTKIYNGAFQNCTGFTGSLVIPNSVTWLSGFNGCTGFTGSLVIPNSVDTIGGYAFQGCTGFIGSLTLGNSVNRIGLYAFKGCTGFLGVLNIPNSVTSIGQHAFESCSGFWGSLTIPNSVTSIEESAFSDCDGFTGSLTIGNSVTTIGGHAFSGCDFTGSLTIGNSVTTIGKDAFSGCNGFTGSLTIPNSVTTIGNGAFYGCGGFTGSLTIPNSVTTIGNSVFEFCNGFTGHLTIPNSVTTIGNSAFSYCYGFTGDLTIPNSVTTIGNSAFSYCYGFTGDLTIPNSVTSIGDYAFEYCSGFTGSLIIPNSVVTIGQRAFRNCNGFVGSLTISNSMTSIGYQVFYNCSGFTGDLTIPNSVATIGDAAFFGCSGFTGDLVIPNSVFTIKGSAFYGCSGFTGSLTIGNSVVTIEEGAFQNCSGFTGVLVIPNSVFTIGRSGAGVGAFKNCSGFTGLVLGESLMSIGQGDFMNCTGFTEIYSNNVTPPAINNSFSIFSVPVYVPCGFETAYQAAMGWNSFTDILGMCSGTITVAANPEEGGDVTGGGYYEGGEQCTVTAIANEYFAFANWTKNGVIVSTNATYTFFVAGDATLVANFMQDGNIVFADANVKSICVSHWDSNGDGELSYVEAASVTDLSYYFQYNSNLISFDELQYFIGLSSIGDYAFYYCDGLTSTVLPNSVTTIGDNAFFNCWELTSIEIPSSVTTIGSNAFNGCNNVQSITSWATTPPSIGGYYTFYGLYDKQLIVPCDAIEAYQNADYWSNFTEILGMCGGTVTVEANPEEYGDVTGGGYYESGMQCTVTAVANEGFTFTNWTKNGVIVSTNAEYTFPVTGNVTLVANFMQDGNIVFADANVKSICVSNWDTDDDGELSYVEAASVTDLSYYFQYNSNLTSFDELQYFIGLSSIGAYAFCNCSGLVSIELPSTLTTIGYDAFYYCYGLTSIVLPSSVTTIGDEAFYGCDNVQSITSWASTPPNISYYTFSSLYDKQLTVPCEALEAYQNANYWSNFTNIICMSPGMAVFMGGSTTNHWNDPNNWIPNELPTGTSLVSIMANVEVNVDANVASVTINGDNVITINPDVTLTVAETLSSPAASSIVVEEGGQLVHANEGVLATVKRTITPYTAGERDGWHLISSPLADDVNASEIQNMTTGDYDLYYYDEPTVYWMNYKDTENNFTQLEVGEGYLYANSGVIPYPGFDQAKYVTNPGAINGYDASVLQGSQSSFGVNVKHESGYRLGEDFTMLRDATIQSIEVFGYQTGSTTTSTFTGMYIQIYDGNPMEGGQPIWGNMEDNIITATSWTGCYRCNNNMGTTRPIMSIKAENLNIPLEAGTYYLTWNLSGSESSGPWGIPVAIQGVSNTGDGLQYSGDTWNYYLDSGSQMGIGFAFGITWLLEAGTMDDVELSFSGELQNGTAEVEVPLVYTTGHALQGFNLVGNPYAHNVTSYASVNVANGCYVMNEAKDDLIVSEISEENPLKPAEGFFVKATAEGASITFNPQRGNTNAPNGTIRVELSENDRIIDRLLMKIEGQPLEKFSLSKRRTRLFAQGERQELSIVPCEGNEQTVSFKAAKNGQYTINVNAVDKEFNYLHLIDNLTGEDVDLLVEPSYTFEASTNDYASRFLLRFIPKNDAADSSETFAFISDGNIVIIDADINSTLQIIDMTGRVVVST